MIQLRVSHKKTVFFSIAAAMVVTLVMGLLLVQGRSAQAEGDGSDGSPFIITTCQQLQDIDNDLTSSYALGSDIDCTMTSSWNGGSGFSPIGFDNGGFQANFDGQNHTIAGLTINRPADTNVGLFAYMEVSSKELKNVKLKDPAVTGGSNVGALIGYLYGGTIQSVKITNANIESNASITGGLVGLAYRDTISDSYVSGAISGTERVGGLVGQMTQGFITRSAAEGRVSGASGTNDYIGGLVGVYQGYGVTDSYSTADVNGADAIGGLIGLVNSDDTVNIVNNYSAGSAIAIHEAGGLIGRFDMSGAEAGSVVFSHNFSTALVDVTGDTKGGLIGGTRQGGVPIAIPTEDNWYDVYYTTAGPNCIGDDTSNCGFLWNSSGDSTYFYDKTNVPLDTWNFDTTWMYPSSNRLPKLRMENNFNFASGDGASVNPYQITTCDQLQLMFMDYGASYELANNVDCAETGLWNGGAGFNPVGNVANPFTGSFDGKGHTISNLQIIRADDDVADNGLLVDAHYVGLFGHTDGATIQDFKLLTSKIKGYQYVGGVIGFMSGGTLNGVSVNTTTDNSDTTCTNPGASCVWARYGLEGGGLVGHQSGGTIQNSHVGGPVKGSGNIIGGLVGYMENGASVTDSTANSHIDGGSYLGGAVGQMLSGSILTRVQASGGVYATTNDEVNKPGEKAGGLVGSIEDYSSIIASQATGDVHADLNEAGGLVGIVSQSTIQDSYATGDVEVGVSFAGGLIGTIIDGQISRNYATGSVYSDDETAGGLIGRVFVGSGDAITDNFSIGAVTADGGRVGAFIGVYNTLSPDPTIEHNYYDVTGSGLSYCTNLYDTDHYDMAGCDQVNADNTQPGYFFDTDNEPFSAGGNPVWNNGSNEWFFDGIHLPVRTGMGQPLLVSPAQDPDATSKAYRDLKIQVNTPGYGLSGSFKVTLTPVGGGPARVIGLSNMPTGMHFFTFDSADPASSFQVTGVTPSGPIAEGTYTVTFSYIAEADGITLLSTTAHNVVILNSQSMLCEQPESTNTTISAACTNQPYEGWGATTWEARYRKASDATYTAVELDDPTVEIPRVSLSGLTSGTLYYVEFRYTNTSGPSEWGRVEVTTTGTAPIVESADPHSQTDADKDVPKDKARTNVANSEDDVELAEIVPTLSSAANGTGNTNTQEDTPSNTSQAHSSAGWIWWWWIPIVVAGVTIIIVARVSYLSKKNR
jgi:hypothetical protein